MRRSLALTALLVLAACSSADTGGVPTDGGGETDPQSSGSASAADPSGPTTADPGTTDDAPTSDPSGPSTANPSGTDSNSGPADPTTADDESTGAATSTTGSEPDVPPGSTVPLGGGAYFLLGANYPWKSYGGDFGGNAWGTYGVHTQKDAYDADFQKLAGAHLEVVRWFVFTDGRAGVVFDNSGTPTGLGEHVLADLDAAVEVARGRGVYLVPVLLDFHWMFHAKQEGQVQLGGRSDTLTDPTKRAALVDNVIAPLLDAYAAEPAILAWEIMNEPEWGLADIPDGQVDGQANAVKLADFYDFSAQVADAVHARTGAYATLGSACLKWLKVWTPAFAAARQWQPIDLDFYQVHYYPWMDGQSWTDHPDYGSLKFSPMDQPYAELGLDRPLVVGEFVLSDSAAARLDVLKNNGYAGAWPWSLNSDFSLDLGGMQAWAEAQGGLVDLPAP